MQAAGNINPLSLFQSFMEGTDPSCASVSLPIRSVNNVTSMGTGFVTETDIRNIDPCIFVGGKNPVSGATRGNCGGGAGGFEMGKGTCVGCTIEGFENQNSEHKQDIAHYQNIVESMLFLSAVLVLIFIISKSLKK